MALHNRHHTRIAESISSRVNVTLQVVLVIFTMFY